MPVELNGQALEPVLFEPDYFLTIGWWRYFLASFVRSVPKGATRQQQVLASLGTPYTSLTGGPGDSNTPAWVVAHYAAESGSGSPHVPVTLVALGGTASFLTWLNHVFSLSMVTWAGPGRVNQFWATSAGNIAANIASALGGAPFGDVILTGFSWGGATAQILAYTLAAAGASSVKVVTFGSPKAGNQAFADGFNAYCDQQANPWDPVPYLPPRMSMLTQLALGGGGPVFSVPQNYVAAPVVSRWAEGVGHAPNFIGGVFGTENAVYSQALINGSVNRNHNLYYYAKVMRSAVGGDITQGGSVAALQNGFDLAGLQATNAQMSVDEGLVVSPAFPVPLTAEP